MAVGIIDHRRANNFASIGLDGRIERFLQADQLVVDTFFDVAIAVVIDFGASHTHVAEIFNGGHIFVALGTVFDLYFERMRAVTFDTGLIAINVGKVGIVGFALIFIATLGQRTIFAGRGGVVMNILET